ncbi:methyltransferase domain-containing protein [Sphingomonas sp. NY01]|uniref:methyltransferase domain-containing protein n=1 Tax=Sphingomonas sp. NY01 TaxID=2968057 RepID=UPI00315DA93C
MSLATRAPGPELMDAEDLDPGTYRAVLHDLARVNTVTMARRPTLRFLDSVMQGRSTLRLLDVGFGDGDMLRSIARWAKARGIVAQLVGIDLNPNSAGIAAAQTGRDMPIDYRTGDYAALAGQEWDVIASSLVTHHMSEAELIAFLRFMEQEARVGWFVNDLHRHRFAHVGYPLLARAARWHPIVRHDGRLSIARSFRPAEWRDLLAAANISAAKIERRFPFRLCVARRR